MTAPQNTAGARPRFKEEVECNDYADTPRREMDFLRDAEHVARLRRTARELAADAGFGVGSAKSGAGAKMPATREVKLTVNRNGGPLCDQPQMKTPKYSGKADWEAFYAQFELLARAAGWSEDIKALQLALCLTDDAARCLLLLSPEERGNYEALVGALQRRFGQCNQPAVLRSELANRQRLSGEPLRVLAAEIETLTRRAYSHMPAAVQSELARDQFIRALSPRELRVQTQLAHPRTLQNALEIALERELVGATTETDVACNPVVRAAGCETQRPERPAWVSELTEMIRAVSLQPPQSGLPRRRGRVCWVCGQSDHISVQCPKRADRQGNGPGSA